MKSIKICENIIKITYLSEASLMCKSLKILHFWFIAYYFFGQVMQMSKMEWLGIKRHQQGENVKYHNNQVHRSQVCYSLD